MKKKENDIPSIHRARMLENENTPVRKVIIIRSRKGLSRREKERSDIAEGSRNLNQIPAGRCNYCAKWPLDTGKFRTQLGPRL